MSERMRILAVTTVAVVPLMLFGLLTIRLSAAEHEARIISDREGLARAAAQTVDAYIDGNLSTVRSLAIIPAIRDPLSSSLRQEVLARLAVENPEWEGIGLLSADGTTIAANQSTDQTVNVADRPYFQRVIATGEPTVSDPVLGRVRGVIVIPLAAPIDLSDGSRGVLVASLSAERLAMQLESLYAGEGVQIALIDREGRAFVHPDPTVARSQQSLRGQTGMDLVLTGQTGAQQGPGPDGVDSLVTFAPASPYGWGVLTYQHADVAFAPVRNDLVRQLALLGALIIVVVILLWHYAGRLAAVYRAAVEARKQAEEARAAAEQARQRATFLARMSQELARSLDYETTLQNVARLAVPEIADWCVVDIADDDGSIRRVAVAHVDPAKQELALELRQRYPLKPSDAVPVVIQTGTPLLVPEVLDFMLEAEVKEPEYREILRGLGPKSIMVVPMFARERVLGALTFLSSESGIRFDSHDLAFAQDAAARAALAIENARLYRDLELAIRTRDEYLAAISHDLRNPLTAIRGSAQLVARLLKRLELEQPEPLGAALGIIDSATVRMERLVKGLLDLARLETGRPLELQRTETDLAALARQVAGEVQQSASGQTIDLEADVEVIGEWDSARLERVIANLLDNAMKFSHQGSHVEVRVREEQRRGSAVAVLEVTDRGIGIPAEDLPRVFDRFHRGSNVVGRIGGTGLGLAGARQIVEEHGGSISLTSEQGKGTTIRVELPLAADEPAPTAEPDSRGAEMEYKGTT